MNSLDLITKQNTREGSSWEMDCYVFVIVSFTSFV